MWAGSVVEGAPAGNSSGPHWRSTSRPVTPDDGGVARRREEVRFPAGAPGAGVSGGGFGTATVTAGAAGGGYVPIVVKDTAAIPAGQRRYRRLLMSWTP